jgi:hypothetical protein
MREYIGEIDEILTMKDLENEFFRKQIFSDEDKKLWNDTKKYNL